MRLGSLFLAFLFAVLLFNGCSKDNLNSTIDSKISISKSDLNEIDYSINSVYKGKMDLALNYNNRENIKIDDIFYSAEVAQAVRYQFLFLAEMGMIKEYSHEVQILQNEITYLPNGSVVVPGLEKVVSTSVPPNSLEKIQSEYTDKHFFTFTKIDDKWKLSSIEILLPFYGTETKYSKEAVSNFAITDSEMEQKAKINDVNKVLFEERQAFKQLFDNQISELKFGEQLYALYKSNDLLPTTNELKSQGSLNKTNAANYAKTWTDNSGSTSSTYYNNSVYRSYSPTDCANYCSQSLKAGGWQYETPYTNWSLWWYDNKKTTKTSDDNGSNPWVGANALFKYVVPSKATLKSVNQAHAGSVGLADLIWIPASGTKSHVMMTTNTVGICLANGTYYTYIYYSAHTSNRKNYNLGSYTDVVFGHFP
jgi:hypothetical protein